MCNILLLSSRDSYIVHPYDENSTQNFFTNNICCFSYGCQYVSLLQNQLLSKAHITVNVIFETEIYAESSITQPIHVAMCCSFDHCKENADYHY
jgi:hypothetical protein